MTIVSPSVLSADFLNLGEQIRELNAELKEARKELKLCRDIRERSGQVERNLETVLEDRTRGKEKKQL